MAGALLVFLSSSAHTDSSAALPGADAPSVEISNEQGFASLASLRGQYVIVNFWSSADPQSRIDNALYDRAFSHDNSGVTCISICTDTDREMFSRIVAADGLQPRHQYHHKDARLESVLSDYGVVDTNASYLIGPDGKVVAVNPDVSLVKDIVKGRA